MPYYLYWYMILRISVAYKFKKIKKNWAKSKNLCRDDCYVVVSSEIKKGIKSGT